MQSARVRFQNDYRIGWIEEIGEHILSFQQPKCADIGKAWSPFLTGEESIPLKSFDTTNLNTLGHT